jgi:hypothetical protein
MPHQYKMDPMLSRVGPERQDRWERLWCCTPDTARYVRRAPSPSLPKRYRRQKRSDITSALPSVRFTCWLHSVQADRAGWLRACLLAPGQLCVWLAGRLCSACVCHVTRGAAERKGACRFLARIRQGKGCAEKDTFNNHCELRESVLFGERQLPAVISIARPRGQSTSSTSPTTLLHKQPDPVHLLAAAISAPSPHIPPKMSLDAFLKDESARNLRSLLKVVILITIAGAAISSRLFSVIRESTIHNS